MPFKTEITIAEKISVGAFRLNDSLSTMIDKFEDLDVTDQLANVPDRLKQGLVLNLDGFYVGKDPLTPEAGDLL